MNDTQQYPRWQQVMIALGKALCYLALFLGWQLLVSTVYSSVMAVELSMSSPAGWVEAEALYDAILERMAEISLLSGLMTLGSVALFFAVRRRSLRRELWLAPVSGPVLGWGAALAFCLYWLVTLVLSLLPASWMGSYTEASAGLEQTGVLAFLSTAIVAPVVEEVIFRGLVYTRLQRAIPSLWAAVVSSVFFGLCHGEFVWFCYAFVLGFIFALLVRATGSILPGMLMHVVFNATNSLLALTGDWQPGLWLYLLVLLFGTGGTVLCALGLRRAAGRAAALPPQPAGESGGHKASAGRPGPERPAGPAGARWDRDSGPQHKFPPDRM